MNILCLDESYTQHLVCNVDNFPKSSAIIPGFPGSMALLSSESQKPIRAFSHSFPNIPCAGAEGMRYRI